MIFNSHSNLTGQHAFLGASKYHWINYTDEKLLRVYKTSMAAKRGTELHAFAHEAIRLGVKLQKSSKSLNMYVNDAIGFGMTPEQILFYSENCFGTADVISYKSGKLRIHDLKTGIVPASVHQLEVYAALFCLEYRFKPFDLTMELRIYQNDSVEVYDGDPDFIAHIMARIISADKMLQTLRSEGLV